jgi:hypothetical protein
MKKITKEEAFKTGCEAFFKGLPGNPLFNGEFWDRVARLNKHKEWEAVIEEYKKGWSESFRKNRAVHHESS